MSKHPVKLALRFFLEVSALIAFGLWGFGHFESPLRVLAAILLPVLFALLWGVFAVRDDPSRSGKTIIATPGVIRLILELALFGTAAWMFLDLAYSRLALIFATGTAVHYIFSFDRMDWLLKQK